jgi:HK97 family phage prohead protease
MTIEKRYFGGGVELRAEGDAIHIVGHGAVFDTETEIYRGFFEVVRPGAFAAAIASDDVRGLFNHDGNFVLGRTQSKTMTLREDEQGLLYDIVAPDTDLVRDLVLAPMKRGDVTGSSFSFSIETQRWTEREDNELREILKVRRLYDVGPVTFPAYPTADSQVRTLLRECTSADELDLYERFHGKALTPEQRQAMIRRKSELTGAAGSQSESSDLAHEDTMRRKRMLLAAGA